MLHIDANKPCMTPKYLITKAPEVHWILSMQSEQIRILASQ